MTIPPVKDERAKVRYGLTQAFPRGHLKPALQQNSPPLPDNSHDDDGISATIEPLSLSAQSQTTSFHQTDTATTHSPNSQLVLLSTSPAEGQPAQFVYMTLQMSFYSYTLVNEGYLSLHDSIPDTPEVQQYDSEIGPIYLPDNIQGAVEKLIKRMIQLYKEREERRKSYGNRQ